MKTNKKVVIAAIKKELFLLFIAGLVAWFVFSNKIFGNFFTCVLFTYVGISMVDFLIRCFVNLLRDWRRTRKER